MARCIIFCAGGFDRLALPIEKDDHIIAADGGFAHVQKLGLSADSVLGDFDSLGYVPDNALRFPEEKDDTDTMLAVRLGLQLGYREFLLYGTLDGPRLDHTVANLQTLQYLADRGAIGWLIGLSQVATVIKNGSLCFDSGAEGYLSLFCLGSGARGVSLKNLKYPLDNGTLTPGFPLGVSNRFIGLPAAVTVKDGSLLVLYDRKNGLAGRDSNET